MAIYRGTASLHFRHLSPRSCLDCVCAVEGEGGAERGGLVGGMEDINNNKVYILYTWI